MFALVFPLFALVFLLLSGFCPLLCLVSLCLLLLPTLVVFRCRLYGFVFVVSFSLSVYTQKERAQSVFASSLAVCVVSRYSAASGITKLLQAVSILSAFPAIQATEN